MAEQITILDDKKSKYFNLLVSRILFVGYYAFFTLLAVATYKAQYISTVFSFGLVGLFLIGLFYGWNAGFLSRVKFFLYWFSVSIINWLIYYYAHLVTTSSMHVYVAMISCAAFIYLILSRIKTPKVSIGNIDSILGVAYQLFITLLLVIVIGLIGQYKFKSPDRLKQLEKTIPKQMINQLFPVAMNSFISPKNHSLVRSQDDAEGLMFALGVEQKLFEEVPNRGRPLHSGDKVRDFINTPIPFRGRFFKIKNPALIKATEKYLHEIIKKRQMQQLKVTNR